MAPFREGPLVLHRQQARQPALCDLSTQSNDGEKVLARDTHVSVSSAFGEYLPLAMM